ncbi:acyl CoA:acetate/3-ketoacid CoA transferase [Enterovirga sp.]|uniref:acyl CoA:acetate/3-ketoacid CoA transferase n=1 Tax=Enterovirga sp. TaxID=2026350 RepID=UPI002BAF2A1A|nr:acyl CoA:acetate/3-ketoacid CoA transferase [Enterovirga sp.]HMO30988.1 acyl CoA:acetate/3-ketoacid CoA transferase [Enterovirga sp.]
MRNKIVTAAEAAAVVQSGDTITTGGLVGIGVPDALLVALEKRFLETGEPRDLTLVFAAAQGDGRDRGLNAVAHDGLVKRAIGGHWGLVPKLGRLALENRIEGYNLPQGVISHLFRDIAAGKPGTISGVGMGTFVDPRQDGGKINAITAEDLVRVMEIDGKEWLFYKAFPLNVAFLRGTTADANGNVTAEREALDLDNLAQAMAVKNSGGVVIVQVERIARAGSLHPRQVLIPGPLVDCVVVAEPQHHWQTYATVYNPAYSSEIAGEADTGTMAFDERKLIARRCAMELRAGAIVNLGIGIPEGVAAVAGEERIGEFITLTAESGVIGGLPASGLDFGAATGAEAVIHQNQQFDFYDGGGLDLTVLGMAEADAQGNVNVSRFGPKLAGSGGFINISQNARKIVYAGTFAAGGLDIAVEDGRLRIVSEGRSQKFHERVQQITFSGPVASAQDKPVLYVTERCVFRLGPAGMELIEVAPGIDVDRDILALMKFRPVVRDVALMDPRIFNPEPMGLRDRMLDLNLSDRFAYDSERNILFINCEGLHIRTLEDVRIMREAVATLCQKIGRRVAVVANYDAFQLDVEAADAYAEMVRHLEDTYYTQVSRYTTSAFMRLKVGQILTRTVRPHIFESRNEAQAFHENVS